MNFKSKTTQYLRIKSEEKNQLEKTTQKITQVNVLNLQVRPSDISKLMESRLKEI